MDSCGDREHQREIDARGEIIAPMMNFLGEVG
jgi:hypothetical protein